MYTAIAFMVLCRTSISLLVSAKDELTVKATVGVIMNPNEATTFSLTSSNPDDFFSEKANIVSTDELAAKATVGAVTTPKKTTTSSLKTSNPDVFISGKAKTNSTDELTAKATVGAVTTPKETTTSSLKTSSPDVFSSGKAKTNSTANTTVVVTTPNSATTTSLTSSSPGDFSSGKAITVPTDELMTTARDLITTPNDDIASLTSSSPGDFLSGSTEILPTDESTSKTAVTMVTSPNKDTSSLSIESRGFFSKKESIAGVSMGLLAITTILILVTVRLFLRRRCFCQRTSKSNRNEEYQFNGPYDLVIEGDVMTESIISEGIPDHNYASVANKNQGVKNRDTQKTCDENVSTYTRIKNKNRMEDSNTALLVEEYVESPHVERPIMPMSNTFQNPQEVTLKLNAGATNNDKGDTYEKIQDKGNDHAYAFADKVGIHVEEAADFDVVADNLLKSQCDGGSPSNNVFKESNHELLTPKQNSGDTNDKNSDVFHEKVGKRVSEHIYACPDVKGIGLQRKRNGGSISSTFSKGSQRRRPKQTSVDSSEGIYHKIGDDDDDHTYEHIHIRGADLQQEVQDEDLVVIYAKSQYGGTPISNIIKQDILEGGKLKLSRKDSENAYCDIDQKLKDTCKDHPYASADLKRTDVEQTANIDEGIDINNSASNSVLNIASNANCQETMSNPTSKDTNNKMHHYIKEERNEPGYASIDMKRADLLVERNAEGSVGIAHNSQQKGSLQPTIAINENQDDGINQESGYTALNDTDTKGNDLLEENDKSLVEIYARSPYGGRPLSSTDSNEKQEG